ncbi:MAG TPA: lysozyme inhibitor LprI family protein [Acidobacteriaceae bacterium]
MRTGIAVVLFCGMIVPMGYAAQDAAPSAKKVLTPAQAEYQQKSKEYFTALAKLRATANSAYDTEMARAKGATCPSADTTLSVNECLSGEITVTQTNYVTFVSALRCMLSLPLPALAADKVVKGNVAHSEAAKFDHLQTVWTSFAKEQCRVAVDQYRGGTIMPSVGAECELRQMRARLTELDTVYDGPLHR